jgi:hypothetical protein
MNRIVNTNNRVEIERIAAAFEKRLVEKGVRLEQYSTTAHNLLVHEYCENRKIHKDCTGKNHEYRTHTTNILLLDFVELAATTGDYLPLVTILHHNSEYNVPYIEFPQNVNEPATFLCNTYQELVNSESSSNRESSYGTVLLLCLLGILAYA